MVAMVSISSACHGVSFPGCCLSCVCVRACVRVCACVCVCVCVCVYAAATVTCWADGLVVWFSLPKLVGRRLGSRWLAIYCTVAVYRPCLSVCPFLPLSIFPSIHLSIYPSIHPATNLSLWIYLLIVTLSSAVLQIPISASIFPNPMRQL
jgi:hypothetical protein